MNNFVIDSNNSNSGNAISEYLYSKLKDIYSAKRPIVFLCIGTDRSTGDSLGPLIGYKLFNIQPNNIYIYGSLYKPIHSKNLILTLEKIHSKFNNPYIVAIDSCLGTSKTVGKIYISNKSLRPGLALSKNLPQVGDISITGIVNISGSIDFIVLQNTRLYTVMKLADSIYAGIYNFIIKCTNSSYPSLKEEINKNNY